MFSCAVLNGLNVLFFFVNTCTTFFDLSDFLFCSSFIVLLYSLLKTNCYIFQIPRAHIHDREGNLTWMLKIASVVFTTTQKLQFKNVSSRPSHLSNREIIYYKVCIFNNNLCLHALCLAHEQ